MDNGWIVQYAKSARTGSRIDDYGDGKSSQAIVNRLLGFTRASADY